METLINDNQVALPTTLKPEVLLTCYKRQIMKAKLPKVLPSIPLRAMWEQAKAEDQNQAQKASMVIMEYWLGRLTKTEAAAKLEMKPIRVWQLSQQAILGMSTGLLTRPRFRKADYMKADEQKIKELEKKIKKLEKVIETQKKLIEVLKTLPGNKNVELKDEKKGKKKNAVPKIAKGKGGSVASDSPLREPADSGRGISSHEPNVEILEDLSSSPKD